MITKTQKGSTIASRRLKSPEPCSVKKSLRNSYTSDVSNDFNQIN